MGRNGLNFTLHPVFRTLVKKTNLKGPKFYYILSEKLVMEQKRVNYRDGPYWVSYNLLQEP